MLDCAEFYSALTREGVEFFAGVPDSLLKPFCAYVQDEAAPESHVIAANEGAAVGYGVGHHIATGKVPLVYMQNSGLGNSVNPLISAVHPNVFGVPMVLMIGWRGEPDVADEPQHQAQGAITPAMLDVMGISYSEISGDTAQIQDVIGGVVARARKDSNAAALLVRKGTFAPYASDRGSPQNELPRREDLLSKVLELIPASAAIVATTGKLSRELFELREGAGPHFRDLLTVGSMGHCSAIAQGIALARPESPVYCLDGDGSLLMHMGTLAIGGASNLRNFRYVLFNNGAHESVGGQPTVGFDVDFPAIAEAVGFRWARRLAKGDDLETLVGDFTRADGAAFLELPIGIGSRGDLGRPTLSPAEVKRNLMDFLDAG